jgi:uncharacterized RDD family membrane protein YckC
MLRNVEVRTGEAVAIRYELAGLGSRFLAVVIDGVAQIAIVLVVLIAIGVADAAVQRVIPHPANVEAWLLAALAAFLFAVFAGWFIIFETWWGGRTPGKRVMGLRVVRDGGFPVDLGAAVIRNVVRLVEMALGFYALSAISALLSKENKRLGDYAAGTLVVRDRVEALPDLDAYLSRPVHGATGLAEHDRVLIERFLARRAALEPQARVQLATAIAQRIRPTLVAPYTNLGDEALLEYLAGS